MSETTNEESISQYETAIAKRQSMLNTYKKALSGEEGLVYSKEYITQKTDEYTAILQAFDHILQKFGRVKDAPKHELMAAQINKYKKGIKTVEDSIKDYTKAITTADRTIEKNHSLKIDPNQFKAEILPKMEEIFQMMRYEKKYYTRTLVFKQSPLYTKNLLRKASALYYQHLETSFKQQVHDLKSQLRSMPNIPEINYKKAQNMLKQQIDDYPNQVDENCKPVEKRLHKLNKKITSISIKSPPKVNEILALVHNADVKIAYTQTKFEKEKAKLIEMEKLQKRKAELSQKSEEISKLKRRLLALEHLKKHSQDFKTLSTIPSYPGQIQA